MKNVLCLSILVFLAVSTAFAYPLDDYERTGISRLEGYYLSQKTPSGSKSFPAGALLNAKQVKLRLLETDFKLPSVDAAFSRQLAELLGAEASMYGIAIVDLSDLSKPLYAEHNASRQFNPGSVGKIVVALSFLNQLAEMYPNDISARERVLRESEIVADEFIISDSHAVPLWNRTEGLVSFRPLRLGDRGNIWMFLDYMMSASSNASASMVMKHLLLLKHFGASYPPAEEQSNEFFEKTSKLALGRMLRESLDAPIVEYGLNLNELRQGGFFTSRGKQKVPGGRSVSTARELLRYLVLLEQGELVDRFSSLELKRLLYMTQRRIRYASSPALAPAAVYFKSGSLYRCKPEVGFTCKKYHGNVENMMNSVAIVEYPAENPKYFYLVALNSNVLRKNSAVTHQTIATKIQRLIEKRHFSPSSNSEDRKPRVNRSEQKPADPTL